MMAMVMAEMGIMVTSEDVNIATAVAQTNISKLAR